VGEGSPRIAMALCVRPPMHRRLYHVRGPTGRGRAAGTYKAVTERENSAPAAFGMHCHDGSGPVSNRKGQWLSRLVSYQQDPAIS